MINKKYMYGQLNKESARVNYGGLNTDSLKINVDNDNMIISGDVQWQNMLGQTSDKAYPGNLGARNYDKILVLAKQLQEEIARSTSADEELKNKLLEGFKVTDDIEATINGAVSKERARSEAAEAKLREQMSRGDSENRILVTNLEAVVQEEAADRKEVTDSLLLQLAELQRVVTEAVETLTNSIDSEVARSTRKDNELDIAIRTEVGRATSKEAQLATFITNLEASVEELDDKIETKLSESTSASEQDLRLLSSKVDEAIYRSTLVDNSLQTQVSNLDVSVSNLKLTTQSNTDRITPLETMIPQLTESVDGLEVKIDEEVKVREEKTSELATELESIAETVESNKTELDDKIHTETVERLRDIRQVNSRIDAINSDIPDRVSALEETVAELPTNMETSFAELQQELTSETQHRQQADVNLQKYVNSKVDKLQEVDKVLAYNIEHMGSTLQNRFVNQVETDGELRLYSVKGSEDGSVIASADASANTVVVRTDNGQIELPIIVTMEETEDIGEHQAVSKTFVKLLMGALEDDYNSQLAELRSIKFIDGGNAPI